MEIFLAENVFAGSRGAAVNELSRLAVNGCMARGAKRDQVLFRSRGRSDSETVCDGLLDSTSCHMIDTSSRHDAGSAGADFRTTRDPAASGRLLRESLL